MTGLRRDGFDMVLFITAAVLAVAGILMVFSSSAYVAGDRFGQTYHYMVQQVGGAVVGLLLIVFLAAVRRTFFLEPFFVYGLLGLSVFLLVLCLFMPSVANTNRWVMLFGFRFQPSELAKVSLVLFLAAYCGRKKDRLNEWKTLLVPAAATGVPVLLVLMEPDFGTAMLLFCLAAVVLFLGGLKFRYIAVVIALFCAVFAFSLFRADYRVERVQGFLAAEKDVLGSYYQVNQSKLAVGAGGMLGVGFGQGIQKLYYLPFAHTDFIFAIIGEEMGLLGTGLTLAAFLVLLWRGLRISFSAPDPASRMAAAGLTFGIVFQALLNITIVLGLGPAKGITLPLISYGRSSLVCTLAAVGLLLHISQKKWAGVKR